MKPNRTQWRRPVLVTALVFVLVLSSAGGYRLVQSYRRDAAAKATAQQQASATARVADDISVCGIAPASTIEAATGHQITTFTMATWNGFRCNVHLDSSSLYDYLEISYNDNLGRVTLLNILHFDELEANDNSSPLTIDGLDGRGVTYRDDASGVLEVDWQYPDGKIAGIHPSNLGGATDAQRDAAMNILLDLFPRIAPTLPSTSLFPCVLATSYPEETGNLLPPGGKDPCIE